MDELQAIRVLGFATSREIHELLGKSLRNTIKQLSKLEEHYEINVLIFKTSKHRKKVYIKDEIYNDLCKINWS